MIPKKLPCENEDGRWVPILGIEIDKYDPKETLAEIYRRYNVAPLGYELAEMVLKRPKLCPKPEEELQTFCDRLNKQWQDMTNLATQIKSQVDGK